MAFYGSEQSAEGTCGKAFTVVVSMGKLGPAKAVMFIVIAQLISAYLIELLGMFGVEKEPFSVRKLVGMAVAVIGVIVFKM